MRRHEHAMPKRERGPEFHRARDELFVTVSGLPAVQSAHRTPVSAAVLGLCTRHQRQSLHMHTPIDFSGQQCAGHPPR